MTRRIFGLICGGVALTLSSGVASAAWQVRQTYLNTTASTGNASGGTNSAQLENIDEGEALLAGASGFVPSGNFTDSPATINYSGASFPGSGGASGDNTNDFALEAVGLVTLTAGTTGTFNLYVNSDDGFRLRRNGNVVGEFTGPTGGSNTIMTNVTLNNGDVLRLTFFERAGGEFVRLRVNNDTGAFVGDPASGINITPVPEPASLGLLGVGSVGLLARRRRA